MVIRLEVTREDNFCEAISLSSILNASATFLGDWAVSGTFLTPVKGVVAKETDWLVYVVWSAVPGGS